MDRLRAILLLPHYASNPAVPVMSLEDIMISTGVVVLHGSIAAERWLYIQSSTYSPKPHASNPLAILTPYV